ncbi:MAG: hypothetical protein JXA08_08745 [Methanomicrobiaceae archaeon]|nr:hypothetical protein [Methanomicrobiaceae archaeon]
MPGTDRRTIRDGTLAAFIVLCMIGAGCTGMGPAAPAAEPPGPALEAVVDANNRFACDLYSRLAADPEYSESNLFFSPFSLASALAITYEGARGTTADEMRSVLHFPDDSATLREGFSGMDTRLNAGDASYTLRTANALWAEKAHGFLPDSIATIETWYGAKTTNLDFITSPDESRQIINA